MPILKSIALPSIITATWLLGNKWPILFQEPLIMILIGVILIELANIAKKKLKKGLTNPSDTGRESNRSE